MAALQQLRSKGSLVALIIGLALLAFILGDFLTQGNKILASDQYEIAKVAGKSVDYRDFQAQEEELVGMYKLRSGQEAIDESLREQFRRQVWENLLKANVMTDEYSALGINVTPEELYDMVQGKFIDPSVKQAFTNPQTGEFNPGAVIQFLKNMDNDKTGRSKIMWLYMENEIRTNRLFNKYITLISKGLYTTTSQVKNDFKERNHLVDFKYILQRYNSIPDSAVLISEAELKDYYNKHLYEYKQEATRDLEYVTFDVVPSSDDKAVAEEWVRKTLQEFETKNPEETKLFVNEKSDKPFEAKYYKKGELQPAMLDSVMFSGKIGTMYGPIFADNVYKIAKLVETKSLSDTVKARHILVKVDAKTSKETAQKAIDSLKKLLKDKKVKFEDLAKKHSQDEGSAAKGGDLGWFKEGAMVKSFNDSCFLGKKGDLKVVETQYGIHLIEILDKGKETKKVQVAILEHKLEASSRTYQNIFGAASKFAGTNNTAAKFDEAIKTQKLTKKVAPNLNENDRFIAGLENPRELVRWAFRSKKNDVSQVLEMGSRFVIAKLKEAREKGTASLEQVKQQVEMAVRLEKKATMLAEKIKGLNTLEEIAQKVNVPIQEAKNISFSAYQIPGAGNDFEAIAAAMLLEKDKVSPIIKSKTGVFVMVVTSITNPEIKANMDFGPDRSRLNRNSQMRATYQAYEALKEAANIEDHRAKFF